MSCIKCGKEAQDYHFRVLQVQTLHVRDLNKEKRVQALGDFEEYDVCASCAEAKYQYYMNDSSAMLKSSLLYGCLMVVGLILTIAFRNGEGVFRLLGLAMTVGAGLGLYGTARAASAKKRELAALSRNTALYRCAWECLVDGAPKKHDINDITYIPVDEETLARKNGDLMILYELLPEIAIEAHKRIHGQAE